MNENNFTSHMWWALIEEISPRAEKEIACCVRGHVYLDTWAAAIREVLVDSTEPTNNVGNIFVVKVIRIKYFCTFSVYKNIFTTKIKELRYFIFPTTEEQSKNKDWMHLEHCLVPSSVKSRALKICFIR